jgi:hypothetical protein
LLIAGWPLLLERNWLHPVLDTFMRGLPRAYRTLEAGAGTSIAIEISGDAGGEWTLCRIEDKWRLFAGRDSKATSFLRVDQDLAWRLFTKGISPDLALPNVQLYGDEVVGRKVLDMVTIMA